MIEVAYTALGVLIGTTWWVYFLARYFPKKLDESKEQIKTEIIEAAPKIVDDIIASPQITAKIEEFKENVFDELDIGDIVVKILNDSDVAETVQNLADKYLDHVKKSIAGSLGVDAKMVKKAEGAILNYVEGQAGGEVGNIINAIVGDEDDLDLKKVVLKLIMPFLQDFLKSKFGKAGQSQRYY